MATRLTTIDALVERVARLDARIRQAPGQLSLNLTGGGGVKCGDGWISPDKTCRKGKGSQKPLHPLIQETVRRRAERDKAVAGARPAAAVPAGPHPSVTTGPDGAVLINGKPPRKTLGSGAFGDAYMADTAEGPVVVKVDRLSNGDPRESDPSVSKAQQRRNMVERERANMQRAHELGLAAEPLGPVQELPDGRLAFAYRMIPGVKLAEDHRSPSTTPEARAILEQPGALGRYAEGIKRIARTLADAGFDHGDLHPGNVILGPDGTPSLVDWGFAKQAIVGSTGARVSVAHEIAQWESTVLEILGGGMIQVNGQADRGNVIYGYGTNLSTSQVDVGNRPRDAAQAYRLVIDEFEFSAPVPRTTQSLPALIKEANRLVREQGMDFNDAEREVGLLPKLTPDVIQRAEQARDAHFGPADLAAYRQRVDEHYRQWRNL